MAPPDSLRLLVVSHTHWDREWYHAAGRFRQRLVALVDELLDDPPPEGSSFLLDGQGIVLDDYLAVRPERAAELGTLLRDGRLEAGPWYVLADELIPSGEALVRNLLAGRDALRALRADPPTVLYCPDAFGHPAVLPALASGFGLDLIVVWRGYGGPHWPAGDTVRWRDAAGHRTLVYHLTPDGYELGSSLPVAPVDAVERWRRLEKELAPRATTGIALLFNGADHHARQRDLATALRALADAAHPSSVAPSTLRSAAAALRGAAEDRELPVIDGELRDSYGYTWTLQGTLATRAHQKRANSRLERTLVRDVEPWIALATQGGAPGTRAVLRAIWRALLEGQPHDTLCGTSVDAVAEALDTRQADVEDRSCALREAALDSLLDHDVERARRAANEWRPAVVLRNRVPRTRSGVVELVLQQTLADVAVGPGSASRQGALRRLAPWRVEGMPLQVMRPRRRVALTESPRDYPDADLVAEVRALGWADDLGGYSVETRPQNGASKATVALPPNVVRVNSSTMENGLLRVVVASDGAVSVEDLASGRVVADAFRLEDADDVGDLYTSAIRAARPVGPAQRVQTRLRGPLRGEIAITYALPRDRRPGAVGRCTLSVVLDANASFVRVRVDGSNRASDHRLRLHIATDQPSGKTIADAAFRPVVRAPLELSPGEQNIEHVVPTAPLHRWVTRFTATGGATVFSDGLAEYESLPGGAVAVTLLRAVGELSRVDLPERPGHAGWPADTPLAQCIAPFGAELALALHGPATPGQLDAIERMADDVLLPLAGETLRSNLAEPRQCGGLELLGDGLAFSAACPARAHGWVVLRCVNRRDVAVAGSWRVGRALAEARLGRLDETPISPLVVRDRVIDFEAPPHAIVTVLARWPDVD
jgi:mannosylglycerate hydrolase